MAKDKDKNKGLTRRGFLALSGLLALNSAYKAEANVPKSTHDFTGNPKSYGMLTDLSACVGCRSCEKACNDFHKMPASKQKNYDADVFKQKRSPSASTYTVVNRYEDPKNPGVYRYRKVQCNHCLEPACATACPMHAYTKTPEGAVIYNEDLCFGCRYCMITCPFNIPAYDYDSALEPKIVKCVFCISRLKEGQMPACAEACPAGALTFGYRQDLIRLAHKMIDENPGKYVNHVYGEHELGGTAWMYISDLPFEQYGLPANLPLRSPLELSKGYLSTVPVIFTTFPAIFGLIYAASKSRHKEEEDADNAQH